MRAHPIILSLTFTLLTGCIVQEGHDVLYDLADASGQKMGAVS